MTQVRKNDREVEEFKRELRRKKMGAAGLGKVIGTLRDVVAGMGSQANVSPGNLKTLSEHSTVLVTRPKTAKNVYFSTNLIKSPKQRPVFSPKAGTLLCTPSRSLNTSAYLPRSRHPRELLSASADRSALLADPTSRKGGQVPGETSILASAGDRGKIRGAVVSRKGLAALSKLYK